MQITDDTLTIHLENVPEIDAFTFPPALGNGITPFPVVPVKVSFDVTYTKMGNQHRIRPTSRDPLSPFNWSGEMWDATNSGSFSVTYDDKSFSASGTFSSSGNFGEMGTERNGSFVHAEDFENKEQAGADSNAAQKLPTSQNAVSATTTNQSGAMRNLPLLKGRFPIQVPNHY